MNYTILQGDNRLTLKTLDDNSIDAIITDPPYGIDFLGKSWDANTGALETYQECLRVLKPGGHILAFSAARTYHHLAITLEQAGFEIRDQIMWIYSSGFPKSQDIGKQIDKKAGKKDPNYGSKKTTQDPGITDSFGVGSRCNKCNRTFNPDIIRDCTEQPCGMQYQYQTDEGKTWAGWGTALKPAHEPIALARKPIKTSIRENCLKYGTGALNIDATRVPYEDEADLKLVVDWANKYTSPGVQEYAKLDGSAERTHTEEQFKSEASTAGRFPANVVGEIEGYQKYFYCPKVSRKERHIGFDELPKRLCGPGGDDFVQAQDHQRSNTNVGNNHPTVKPIELMKYLIKLVTPPGGVVLDPFNGSGSTGCAAVELGHPYIGCELDPAYVEIASKRIEAWYAATRDSALEIFE